MKKEKKTSKKKKIKSLDLQMTLNTDLTAALRFKNVACQSVSVPLRDPYIVVAVVTVVTCLSHGWFQSAVGSLHPHRTLYIPSCMVKQSNSTNSFFPSRKMHRQGRKRKVGTVTPPDGLIASACRTPSPKRHKDHGTTNEDFHAYNGGYDTVLSARRTSAKHARARATENNLTSSISLPDIPWFVCRVIPN